MTPRTRLLRAGLALLAALVLAFAVVAPPERCPSVTQAELRASAQEAVDWFARNQNADGSWLYLYDADRDRAAPEYNVVRHAGAVMGLYQAAGAGLPGALRSADRGTDWSLHRLIERDDWQALALQGQVATGATALLLAGLDIRRHATGDTRYDGVMRRLGRFLVAQTKPSGAVLATYDLTRDAPVPGEYSKYFTGETYWALARLHLDFPGAGWGEVADRIGAYLATRRDDAEHHWPPIEDHWAAYGLSETVRFPERGNPPLTGDELHYARRQAELFGVETRWVSQRLGPWGALVRGAHVPRGGGYGVLGEGLTGLWRTALAEPRMADLREPIAARATCIAALAVDAQSNASDAADARRPGRVRGAWFRDGETRMDDQQHALAALLRTIAIVRAGEGGDSSGPDDETPPAWLWALVLLLALNPPRTAFGEVPVRGALLGGLAVCAAAVLAGPLLDLLNVSDPSFRVAAGLMAAVAGAADLLRRPPSPGPPASLLVARPALIAIALGAGADRGVLPVIAAVAIGVALLRALAAARVADGRQAGALRWTARLLAAALIAGGVVLVVHGILAV
jgi:hypothetical protein